MPKSDKTTFIPISFKQGITVRQFINANSRYNKRIHYDIVCHNEKSPFSFTFAYYQLTERT